MRPIFQSGVGLFNLKEQRLLLLAVAFILLQLLTEFALALAVFAQLLSKLLQLGLGIGKGDLRRQRLRAWRQVFLQSFLHLGYSRLMLLVLGFQRLFQVFQALTLIGVEQCGKEIIAIGEV